MSHIPSRALTISRAKANKYLKFHVAHTTEVISAEYKRHKLNITTQS